MRQFKFKIWCKGTSDNANFNKPGWWRISSYLINKYYPIDHVLDTPESEFRKHFEICQFTGLHDKNGKEIYEGDIVKTYHNFILIVAFEYGAFVLKNKQDTHCAVLGWQSDYESNEMDWADLDDIEVIGNIYENKELLNE